jgi:D-alanyl-D-alanine carboxypeptidase-like protein
MNTSRFFLMSAVLVSSLRAQPPPEIVALTSAAASLQPVFHVQAIAPQLLSTDKTTTWHQGCPVPPEDLRELHVAYWNYGGQPAMGVLIVHHSVASDLSAIFAQLFRHGFLIEHMEPVENFGGSDDRSMEANNTSAFNCRDITGEPGKFSNHSWGRAIDINPLTNPYVKGESVFPPAGKAFLDRSRAYPGAILARSFAAGLFAEHGWVWGGSWKDRKDYQHFEKPAPR